MKLVSQFRDNHQGQRCFILGNGPSLRAMDLALLANEITIGQNAIYKLFMPSYLCSINGLWLNQVGDDLFDLVSGTTHKFIGLPGGELQYGKAQDRGDWTYIGRCLDCVFSQDLMLGFRGGNTVTSCSLQLAFYLGFKQVILIGVDHHFGRQGRPHETVVADGRDQDHFIPDYFPEGMKWQLPDLRGSEWFYEVANRTYEAHGRKIINATAGGKLEVFERRPYEDCFA